MAEIGDGGRSIAGELRCTASAAGHVSVVAYPRILREPVGLDDVNSMWFYPRGFDPAEMGIERDGVPLSSDSARVPLGFVHSGDPVRLQFRTRVPRRRGTFGVDRGIAYLLGGWHPTLAWDEQPAERTLIRYRVSVPGDRVGFVGSHPIRRSARPQRLAGSFRGRFLPAVITPAAQVRTGQEAVILFPQPSRPRGSRRGPATHLRDISSGLDDGAIDDLQETLRVGARFARNRGLLVSPMLVVIAPLRERLVEPFDGGLAVSDRAFHMLPWQLFLKFHRIHLWRFQLARYIESHSRRLEGALPVSMVADAVAAALRDRLALEQYGEREYAPDLLETFALIPEIDTLIFAPRIAFVDTYYEAIDESPAVRWHLDDFDHSLPRGKLLHEKLQDALGAARIQELAARYLDRDNETPWLELGSQMNDGRDLYALVKPWLGPYPVIDYALLLVESNRTQTEVEVTADGPSAKGLREPITVEVEDADGQRHRQQRQGPGSLHFRVPGPVKQVEIDPDGRLVELTHEPGEAPRYNNRTPARWRFLLNNIGGLVAVTGGELHLSVSFSLRRIHDLSHRLSFFLGYAPDKIRGGAGASYSFGPEVAPLTLAHAVGLSALYEWLRPEAGISRGGHQAELSAFYRYDDRQMAYWSMQGKGLVLHGAGGWGMEDTGNQYRFLEASAAAFNIWQLSLRHALLLRLRGSGQFGRAPPQNQLLLGGRYYGARGFERTEARGNRKAILSGEYRHVLVAGVRTDLWGLLTFTRVEGALFADAVYLPVRRAGCHQDFFYDAGYGIRFIYDALNVSPMAIALDASVPFNRCPDQSQRVPLTVYLAVVQSFLAF